MISPERIVPQGTLVAVGGNEDKTTDLEVLRTICNLPEGGSKVVEIIPTASNYPEEAAEQYIEPFTKLGCTTVNIMDIRDRDAANDPGHVQRILDADVVFFTGGDQLRITNLLGGSDLLQTMLGHYQRGGVIGIERAGKLQIDRNRFLGAITVECGSQREQGRRCALLRGPDAGLRLSILFNQLPERCKRCVIRGEILPGGQRVESGALVAFARFHACERHQQKLLRDHDTYNYLYQKQLFQFSFLLLLLTICRLLDGLCSDLLLLMVFYA